MKALAAMSGGVDSAVTAHLLIREGYETAGVNLRLYGAEGCGSEIESRDARAVADKLGIPFYVYDFREQFDKEVISDFVNTYVNGATPNPCVVCNRRVKFRFICETAEREGFDKIATGHYANVSFDAQTGRYLLYKAADLSKDQSYVLYGLTQGQLSKTLFPLGKMSKKQVRRAAEQLGFSNAQKKDSQDVCFIPDGDYAAFIERYTSKKWESGFFTDMSGNILGEHRGIIRYTIGQRKGLGLALPHPMFVIKKDMENNRVILCDGGELYTKTVQAHRINLIPFDTLDKPLRVRARVRYRQPEQWATLTQTGEDSILLEFDEAQRAVAPGQSVVMYDGDLVVGGGIIT